MEYCPECKSANIYRWFCGEYTCQDCHLVFGDCEELHNYITTKRSKGNGK